nr:hypothetical protein [Corynebacterium macginleyi]
MTPAEGAQKVGADFTFPVDAAHTMLDAERDGTGGLNGSHVI